MHVKMIPPSCKSHASTYDDPFRITDSSINPLRPLGVISLYNSFGELISKVQFLVVNNLEVDFILGTLFVDRFVRSILPGRKGVRFNDAPSVGIIVQSPQLRAIREGDGTPSNKV